jgi:hypothetical protein
MALSATFNLLVTNSVFSEIFHIEPNDPVPPLGLDGDFNGFDQASTQFGYHPVVDSDANGPFAPPTSLATAQGRYYPRDGSPFLEAGTPDITPTLKADLTQMTCIVPQLLTDDITSSQTLSPVIPRTPAAPSSYPLGYQYPLVDYIVHGATVNNCTLNIDQGTILAFTSPANAYPIYEWALRLNPGGRLNVYGVPTNRVVFTRLEGIHENPTPGYQQIGGPLITFKGVFLPTGTMITPLPEAHIHYADFPALAGNAVHLGPIFEGNSTYDCVLNLELDGCLFQAGDLLYESGGPQNRTLTFRNNIFERSTIEVMNRQQPSDRGFEETFTAINNLFYDSDIWLSDISNPSIAWTFTDDLFDNSTFHGQNKVAVNHNNGYVNMAPNHLSPTTQTGSNPDLASLAYQSGPLGHFYLPNATPIVGAGSRSPGAAGLFHFTTRVDNEKEGGLPGQVNIGPAYLALDNTGGPVDQDGDQVPDFLEDRNGDGLSQDTESSWTTANDSILDLLYPTAGSTVSGVIRLAASLTPTALHARALTAKIDGEVSPVATVVANPATSLSEVEVDTRYLPNGPHSFSLTTVSWPMSIDGAGTVAEQYTDSLAITLNVLGPDQK